MLPCVVPKDDVKHQTTVVQYSLQVLGFQMGWYVITSPTAMLYSWESPGSASEWDGDVSALHAFCVGHCAQEDSPPNQALRKKTCEGLSPKVRFTKKNSSSGGKHEVDGHRVERDAVTKSQGLNTSE